MNIGTVSVSRHAIDQAIARINIPSESAEQWVRDTVKKARYVANIVSEEGRPSRLFAYNRIAFVLAPDADFVYTVYQQNTAPETVWRKVYAIVMRELAKVERKEKAIERKITVEKARLTIEIAQCRYRMTVTPSKSVLRVNTDRLRQIDELITQLDAELMAAKREKSTLAKGLIAYL